LELLSGCPLSCKHFFVQAYQYYLFNRFLSERIKSGFSLRRAEVGDHVVNVERSGVPMFQSAKFVEQENFVEINALMDAGRMRVALPLVGAKQRLSQGVMGQIERQILEEEGIQTGNFRVSAIRDMSRGGGLRAVISPVKGFKLKQRSLQSDLSFMLLRGSYATVFLREIMKPSDPIKAGF
jgi:tRNA pseudouridine13 synthase